MAGFFPPSAPILQVMDLRDVEDYFAEEAGRSFARAWIRPHKRRGKRVKGHYRKIEGLGPAVPATPEFMMPLRVPEAREVLGAVGGGLRAVGRELAKLVEEGPGVEEAEGIRRGQRVRITWAQTPGMTGKHGTVEKISAPTPLVPTEAVFKVGPDIGRGPLYLFRGQIEPVQTVGRAEIQRLAAGANSIMWPLVGE
jgi:hypothetical protein